MTLTILTFHQIAALAVLFFCSLIIAFCPLLLLRWFYKRKKHRLRRFNNYQHQLHHKTSSISEIAVASTLHLPNIFVGLLRSLNGGLLLASLFLILFPQMRSNFDTLMNSYVYKSQIDNYHRDSVSLLPRPEAFIVVTENDSSLSYNPLEATSSSVNESNTIQFETSRSNLYSSNSLVSKSSPIPIVEVIICLTFFTIYFVEEFIQFCFRYRKYFWACNSTVVLSSSDSQCNYTSLDYRINCTKRFLIDCSRKTFTTSNSSSASFGEATSSRSTPTTLVSSSQSDHVSTTNNPQDSTKYSKKASGSLSNNLVQNSDNGKNNKNGSNNFAELQSFSNSSTHLPSYYWQQPEIETAVIENCTHHQQQMTMDDNAFNLTSHPHNHCHHYCNRHHHQMTYDSNHDVNQNHEDHEEKVYQLNLNLNQVNELESINFNEDQYYQQFATNNKSTLPVSKKMEEMKKHKQTENEQTSIAIVTDKQLQETISTDEIPFFHCCSYSNVNYPQQNQNHQIQALNPINQISDCNSTSSQTPSGLNSSNGGGFTKNFLPNTTQATNIPTLYLGEGIMIAIQPSVALIWLMLFVMLIHKMVTGLLMATELHHRTTGRQRNLPSLTIILFTSLPSLGCLSVIVANMLIHWKINLDLATTTTKFGHGDSHQAFAIPLEYAILKVILVSFSSATLLHLIMLTIQQRHHNYWSTTNGQPIGQTEQKSIQQKQHKNCKVQKQKFNKKRKDYDDDHHNKNERSSTLLTISPSNSHNSRIFLNSFSPTMTLSKPVACLSMTFSSNDSSSDCYNNHNIPVKMNNTNHQNHYYNALDEFIINPSSITEFAITNLPRNNVLHYFIMYSGFIIILMSIAFLNIKNLKL